MNIRPSVGALANIAFLVALAIGQGVLKFAGLSPEAVAAVQAYAMDAAIVITLANTVLHLYSSSDAGPLSSEVPQQAMRNPNVPKPPLAWMLPTLVALLFSCGQVSAADLSKMPVKANPVASYENGGCGVFFGVNALGSAGSVNGAAPGTTIVQGAVGGTLGYGCPIGNTPGNFWFLSGDFDWANLNGTQTGLSMTGPAHFRQMAALGSPLSTVMNLLPSFPTNSLAVQPLPLCPANVTCGNVYPFMFVSLHEQDISASLPVALGSGREWLFSPGFGIGIEQRWSNAVVVDATIEYVLQSNDLTVGPQKVNLGNAVMTGLTFKY